MSHFVAGAIAGDDALRRRVGIGEIVRGIVIEVAHGDGGAGRKVDGLDVGGNCLPVQIPAWDVDEGFCFAGWKSSDSKHVATEIVRVRVDREERDRLGKSEFIGDDKILFTGGNVQFAIVFELKEKREFRCGFVREIDADGWLNFFGFAGRLQVSVENQVVARIETEGHVVRFGLDNGSGLPKKEMAVGIERFGFDLQFHAGETAAGGFFLAASGLRAIDDEICMMNEAAFTGMDFDGFNPACGRDRRAKNKIPIDVAAAGGNFVGRIGMKNQIRLAELPTGVEAGSGRQVGGVTFQHSAGNPFSKERNFIRR